LLNEEPFSVREEEIIDTVLHEMQHHLETKADRYDLSRNEMKKLVRAMYIIE
jgi:hypothetical protein